MNRKDADPAPPKKNKTFDAFLSHNWGKDTRGRDNHARVLRLCQELGSKAGIKTWCDEYDMSCTHNIQESMANGIDNSKKVIVFVTEEYIKKANGESERGTMDNVYREFNYIRNRVKVCNIITVVMEEGAKDLSKWRGGFGFLLAGQLYIDFVEESDLHLCLEKCKDSILGRQEISYEDGGFYEGPVNEKMQRHGLGKFTDCHGNFYEGKFNKDKKRDRHGSIVYKKSGVKFEGRFENDRIFPSSKGTLTLKDGTVMKGQCMVMSPKLGTFRGIDVTFTDTKSGYTYIGDIKANKVEGRGRMEYKIGAVYKGALQDGKKHGKGAMRYENGDVYAGQWNNDMRQGKGKLDLANHDRYVGFFRNDMMQGKGTYLAANGSKYQGYFIENKRCGTGVFTTVDKRVLCGQWKDDKLHGKGFYEYSNGDRYLGYYKESKRHGEGKMMFASGALYDGKWGGGDILEGVFDLEQVERNKKKSRWSRLRKKKSTLFLFRSKNNSNLNSRKADEWIKMPKLRKRSSLFCSHAPEEILATEEFVNISQAFLTTIKQNFGTVDNANSGGFKTPTKNASRETSASPDTSPEPQ